MWLLKCTRLNTRRICSMFLVKWVFTCVAPLTRTQPCDLFDSCSTLNTLGSVVFSIRAKTLNWTSYKTGARIATHWILLATKHISHHLSGTYGTGIINWTLGTHIDVFWGNMLLSNIITLGLFKTSCVLLLINWRGGYWSTFNIFPISC